MKSLSILTICLNAEKTIGRTIESVLAQSFQAWKLIIKDGNSHDGTAEIVRTYEDPRIRFVAKSDLGISDAFSQALMLAGNSEFVLILNSDDRLHSSTSLAEAADSIKNMRKNGGTEPKCYYGRLNYTDGRRVIETVGRPFRGRLYDYCNWPIPHGSLFIETVVAQSIGTFRQDLKYAMDFDWMLRLVARSQSVFMPLTIADMERRGTSVINAEKANRERFRILLSHGLTLAALCWLLYFHAAFVLHYFKRKLCPIPNKENL